MLGASFKATSHALVNASKKSKKNGTSLSERAACSMLGPRKFTSQNIIRAETENPSQGNADQTSRTTCPNLGCAKKPIRSQQGSGTSRVWFDKLPSKSIDNYEVLQKAFLGNFSQQTKYIKGPIEIHHIKHREGESTEAFMERFKAKSMHVNGAPECMRISGFMHGITNLYLIKKLNENIPKSVDEMMNKTTQSFSTGREISFPPLKDNEGQENPIVIEAEVEGRLIHRMYVDGGSALEVLYEHCFNKLHLKIKNHMIPATTHLIGFSGEISWPLSQISLMVSLGDEEHSTSTLMNFMVFRSSSPYNGIVTIYSNTIIPVECRMVAKAQNSLPPREPIDTEGIKVAIHLEYSEQTVTIGESLSKKGRMKLYNLLKDKLDIFAWKPTDMTCVPRSIAEHRLNIREGCQPIRQKRRGLAPDMNKAIQEEVAKLVEAKIMKEVHYHNWISNPFMVKDNKEKDKIRAKPDKIKSKRKARKVRNQARQRILRDKIICDLDKTPDLSQRSPQNCPKCENPVNGHYCQGCALLRKKFMKDLFTSCIENGILQDSFEQSNDNTNVSNAHREPFVVNQDPGIFCHQCTCEFCGSGAHYGYNCPPKVLIIPNSEPFNNQTVDVLPPTVPPPTVPSFDSSCDSKDGNSFTYDSTSNLVHDSPNVFDPPPQLSFYSCEFCRNDARYYEDYYHEKNSCYDHNSFGFDQFQPQQYTVNHPMFNSQNNLFDSQNKLIEQFTSMCDMVGQFIQKKEEEKQIEEEKAANARYWKILACYDDDDDDDDDDYTFVITHNEPVNSLSMGDEYPDTIPATKPDEFIKSSVENFVPNPSESKGDNECDVPACEVFTTFSNILFDADYDFYFSNDQSFSDEVVCA
nr:reverse transcriptase domain-containing protein [Tanacetum cinerariifolium]